MSETEPANCTSNTDIAKVEHTASDARLVGRVKAREMRFTSSDRRGALPPATIPNSSSSTRCTACAAQPGGKCVRLVQVRLNNQLILSTQERATFAHKLWIRMAATGVQLGPQACLRRLLHTITSHVHNLKRPTAVVLGLAATH